MAGSLDQSEAPQGWDDALKRAKADIAAGRTVPLAPVMERLRASAERMEARGARATHKV